MDEATVISTIGLWILHFKAFSYSALAGAMLILWSQMLAYLDLRLL